MKKTTSNLFSLDPPLCLGSCSLDHLAILCQCPGTGFLRELSNLFYSAELDLFEDEF